MFSEIAMSRSDLYTKTESPVISCKSGHTEVSWRDMEADEVKTFASLAEESSKINCNFTIAHFLMESADGAKYYHDLDVDHARWENPIYSETSIGLRKMTTGDEARRIFLEPGAEWIRFIPKIRMYFAVQYVSQL